MREISTVKKSSTHVGEFSSFIIFLPLHSRRHFLQNGVRNESFFKIREFDNDFEKTFLWFLKLSVSKRLVFSIYIKPRTRVLSE